MELRYHAGADGLYLFFDGELDEYSAAFVREKVDALIFQHLTLPKVVFDLGGLSFMDSTGVGVILGRYKKYAKFLRFYIRNPSPAVSRVLGMGGIYDMIPLCG